jgi:hypothetical protein
MAVDIGSLLPILGTIHLLSALACMLFVLRLNLFWVPYTSRKEAETSKRLPAVTYFGNGVIAFDLVCALAVLGGGGFHMHGAGQDAYMIMVLGLYGGSVATVVAICQLDLTYQRTVSAGKSRGPDLCWRMACVSTRVHRGNTTAWPFWGVVLSVAMLFAVNAVAMRTGVEGSVSAGYVFSSLWCITVLVVLVCAVVGRIIGEVWWQGQGTRSHPFAIKQYQAVPTLRPQTPIIPKGEARNLLPPSGGSITSDPPSEGSIRSDRRNHWVKNNNIAQDQGESGARRTVACCYGCIPVANLMIYTVVGITGIVSMALIIDMELVNDGCLLYYDTDESDTSCPADVAWVALVLLSFVTASRSVWNATTTLVYVNHVSNVTDTPIARDSARG